jgi:nitrate/nitrite-specific signal transduction histidine kinase
MVKALFHYTSRRASTHLHDKDSLLGTRRLQQTSAADVEVQDMGISIEDSAHWSNPHRGLEIVRNRPSRATTTLTLPSNSQ